METAVIQNYNFLISQSVR